MSNYLVNVAESQLASFKEKTKAFFKELNQVSIDTTPKISTRRGLDIMSRALNYKGHGDLTIQARGTIETTTDFTLNFSDSKLVTTVAELIRKQLNRECGEKAKLSTEESRLSADNLFRIKKKETLQGILDLLYRYFFGDYYVPKNRNVSKICELACNGFNDRVKKLTELNISLYYGNSEAETIEIAKTFDWDIRPEKLQSLALKIITRNYISLFKYLTDRGVFNPNMNSETEIWSGTNLLWQVVEKGDVDFFKYLFENDWWDIAHIVPNKYEEFVDIFEFMIYASFDEGIEFLLEKQLYEYRPKRLGYSVGAGPNTMMLVDRVSTELDRIDAIKKALKGAYIYELAYLYEEHKPLFEKIDIVECLPVEQPIFSVYQFVWWCNQTMPDFMQKQKIAYLKVVLSSMSYSGEMSAYGIKALQELFLNKQSPLYLLLDKFNIDETFEDIGGMHQKFYYRELIKILGILKYDESIKIMEGAKEKNPAIRGLAPIPSKLTINRI